MKQVECISALILIVVCLHFPVFVESQRRIQNPGYEEENGKKCQPIVNPICQVGKYNKTRLPNLVGLSTQQEAANRMHDYDLLLKINCSQYMKFFLCSIFFPMCTNEIQLKPCKEFCLHIKDRCNVYYQGTGYSWPKDLSCDDLPEDPIVCVKVDNKDMVNEPPISKSEFQKNKEIIKKQLSLLEIIPEGALDKLKSPKSSVPSNEDCSPAHIKMPQDKNSTCILRCGANLLFRPKDKEFSNIWMILWAVLCFVSTGLTILTFIIDRARFQYPERPIVFLSVCYFFYSGAHIVRYIFGPERFACRSLEPSGVSFMINPGNGSVYCTIIFILTYYFFMAASLWWVILTLTWFLSAAQKWGYEGVERKSPFYHSVAWGIPCIKSLIVIITHRIDADELTQMCFVGSQDRFSLLGFVIIPLVVYLFSGFIFLTLGFQSLYTVYKNLKKDSVGNLRRLEKFMLKIGIFSLLYSIPATCVLVGHFYEFKNLPNWRRSILDNKDLRKTCFTNKGLDWNNRNCIQHPLPQVEIYMLKIFMSLVVGTTSGMWVWWNRKTLDSWLNCFRSCFYCQSTQTKPCEGDHPMQVLCNPGHWRPPPGPPLMSPQMPLICPPSIEHTAPGSNLSSSKYQRSGGVVYHNAR